MHLAPFGGFAHGLAGQLIRLQVEGEGIFIRHAGENDANRIRHSEPHAAEHLGRAIPDIRVDSGADNGICSHALIVAQLGYIRIKRTQMQFCAGDQPKRICENTGRMTTLQGQLDEITANTRNLVQPERMALSERAVADLFASGIEKTILPVGAAAPEFTLPDALGRPVRSADLLALGPLVVNFFRGRWCPYCVTEIEAWRDLHPRLREAGALLVAISPQTSRQSDFMVGQHSLPFPVLSDPGCAVAAQFGLAYVIPEYHRAYYRSILVNIPFLNGDGSWRLTLPATYVLGQDRRVVYAEAHADFRVRPEPEEALAAALAAVGK
jgi:peroxiredoxin